MGRRRCIVVKDDSIGEEWNRILPSHLWVYNKLIISQALGYVCGPTGSNVPKPGFYMVQPCMSLIPVEPKIEYIECDTMHLPPGDFWCEVFDGNHYSVFYEYKEDSTGCYPQWARDHSVDFHVKHQKLCLENGIEVDHQIPYPKILTTKGLYRYGWINCEFIDDKLVSVRFRKPFV